MLNRPFIRICALVAFVGLLGAVDIHDRIITGTESDADSVVNMWNLVVASPSGNLTATAGAGGSIHIQTSASGPTRVQQSGVLHLAVPNQPPIVGLIGSNAVGGHLAGTTVSLSAFCNDDGGLANLGYAWTGTGPGMVSWPTGNAAIAVTAAVTLAGSYTFTVTARDQGGLTASKSITLVFDQTPTTLAIVPANVTTTATQQVFTATTRDQFGTLMANPPLSWSVIGGTGSIRSDGLFTAASASTSTVQVAVTAVPSVSKSTTITITPTYHASVSPASATVVVTQSSQFSAQLLDQFAMPAATQPAFSFSVPSAAGTIASTSASTATLTAAAAAGGPYNVSASTTGYAAGTAAVTLVPPPVVYLDLHATPALSLTSTNTTGRANVPLGNGWMANDVFTPDMVNFKGSLGKTNEIAMFIASDNRLYFGLFSANPPMSFSASEVVWSYSDIGPGWISGPATQLQFTYDVSAGTRMYYALGQQILNNGSPVPQIGPYSIQVQGVLPTVTPAGMGMVNSVIGVGTLSVSNQGINTVAVTDPGHSQNALFPKFKWTLAPVPSQYYATFSRVVGSWLQTDYTGTVRVPQCYYDIYISESSSYPNAIFGSYAFVYDCTGTSYTQTAYTYTSAQENTVGIFAGTITQPPGGSG